MAFKRLISYGMTVPFFLGFGLILVLFHPVLIIFHAFGKGDLAMYWLNFALNRNAMIMAGMKYKLIFKDELPSDRPLIVISNHQGPFDITLIYEALARFKLKFIAKIELKRGIPSVSWVLRNLGSALIKRDDPRQSLTEIKAFGEKLEREKLAVLFFPEGTRAKDGVMKQFLAPGVISLLKASPSALIVPAVIDGSWEIFRYKGWPVPFGSKVTIKILDPIEPSQHEIKEITPLLESLLRAELEALRREQGEIATNTRNSPAS
ncbi:MAG: 1-acyl-sn-glycerol-3-phosphate acyltransferase [SAR324 cluster bacterium]|uniref:1-acyl-sn-glycerol-3-phosphate acyltransferase n=1 Tax=SAR324 cluster bacterium TaxID=2024889 RepID=A0A7X9IKU1_9DELT|nr:1-acyl-sn-glycerol-3-phosphate acyltransferase [SAR324 cluster bacterium]